MTSPLEFAVVALRSVNPLREAAVLFALVAVFVLPDPSSGQLPAAPTIDAVHAGDEALTAVWTAPSGVTGITAYDLRWILTSADETVDSNWTTVQDVWSDGPLHHLLTGLANNTSYDIQVRAVTDTDGTWSATEAGTPVEPGATRGSAVALPLDLPLAGRLSTRQDKDYFRFTLTVMSGVVLSSQGPLDTYGLLWAGNGTFIDADDDHGSGTNFLITRALDAGTYYIEVRQSPFFEGPYAPFYNVRVRTIPDTTGISDAREVALDSFEPALLETEGDEDYFKIVLTAETDVLIRTTTEIGRLTGPEVPDTVGELLDGNSISIQTNDDGWLFGMETAFVIRKKLAAGTYYVKVRAFSRDTTGSYFVHVDTVTEPGSNVADARSLVLNELDAGRIDSSTDADYFKINLTRAGHIYLRAVSNTVAIDGAVVNAQDSGVAANVFQQAFSTNGPWAFTVSARLSAGANYLKVTRSAGDSVGGYTLVMTRDLEMDQVVSQCSAISTSLSDPLYGCQWHLRNRAQLGGASGQDIHVEDVWSGGNMGAGIGVAVVDAGVNEAHPDLTDNVDPTRSHDYSPEDFQFRPTISHGTAVAGLIAARDNAVGVRGVAPRATVYGYNLVLHSIEQYEVDAMTRNMETTGVSNNSWGFPDGPGLDAAPGAWEMAVDAGVKTGYGGNGVVYVWAAGNGGETNVGDDSNFDGRANYYATMAACAVNDRGSKSDYSENGANLWVCAPSNHLLGAGIYTTLNYGRYTGGFGGTSAAAPIVAGVAALVRNANPALTWRDVKLILAGSARKNDSSNGGWLTGAPKYGASGNYNFNHQYGFGVVDAKAAANLAEDWENLPPLIETDHVNVVPDPLSPFPDLGFVPDGTSSGPGDPHTTTVTIGREVEFIEFVELVATFGAPQNSNVEFRDLKVELISPSNTVSTLAVPANVLGVGIEPDFRFGSARHLGENPAGTWTLRLTDHYPSGTVRLDGWSLKIYGHRSTPGAPSISFVDGGRRSLAATWSEPTITGTSAISSYDVRTIQSDAANKADGRWMEHENAWAAGALSYEVENLLDGTEYDVQVRGVNAKGAGAWSETAVGTTLPNRAPGESLSPLFLQVENGAQSVDVSSAFTDPTNLTFTAASSDATVATVAVAGSVVTVTPVLHGTTTVTVTGTDGGGSSTTQTFTVTVANRPPQAAGTLPALSLRAEDGAGTVDVSGAFTDPDNDALTFTAASSDATVARAAAAGSVVTVTPLAGGTTTVTVTATDGSGSSATQEFDATVANRSPAAAGTLAALSLRAEDGDRTVDVSGAFTDPDNDDLTYVATSSDETVATVAVADSVVTVTPLSRGTTTVTVTATDVENGSATQTFEVTVANRPPELVGRLAALSLRVEDGDETVDVSGAFTDPDNDDLTFAARSSNETAATVAVSDSVVTVTPLSGGTTRVTVTATDEENRSATQEFEVTVVNRPPLPVGSLADAALQVGDGNEVVEVADAFEDPDGDTLTYGASSSAPGVAGAAVSGSRVTLTPLARGRATITVTATDVTGSNTQASQQFDVRVKARRGVTVSTAELTVTEGSSETYTVVLDSEPTGDVVVTAAAPANADVTVDPSALTFTIEDWQTPQTVAVEAEEDQDSSADPAVTITHQVSGSDYGSVSASSVRVTIVETGTSTLSVTSAGASERSISIFFEVTLSRPSTSEITVDYLTSNGPGSGGARAGSDYTAARGTLTFAANSTASQEIVVAITDDTEDEEEEETFRLTLRNPQNAELAGGESTLQVSGTIEDDDDPEVEVSFGSSSYGVTEGRTVDVVVRLNRDPERDLEIVLEETLHGGGTDADYSGVPQRVLFGPGVTRQQFQVAATDDTDDDDGESVVLSFVSLPPRVSGAGETTIAISDNDGSGGGGGGPPAGGGGGGGVPPPGGDDPPPGDDDDGGGVQPPPPPAPGGPPKADFTLTAECAGDLCRARTGLPVTFEDTSTGRVQSRRWDFGDGTGSRNRRIDHVWAEPGFYEVSLTVSDGTTESIASEVFLVEAGDPAGTCESSAERRCLQDSRYAVTVDWQTAAGSGRGSVVHAGTNDSGLFTFFDRNNWEVLIKVLDGCALNGHVWVYGASTTDLGYVIRVTDTVTGTVKEYRNEPGMPASAVTDVSAFEQGCRPN